MSYAPIVITLQKKNESDDILKITPNAQKSGFDVVLRQHTIGNFVTMYIEQFDIVNYLQRFLVPLTLDDDGYDYVQFDCAGYSSVVLKTSKVETYFPILSAQILAHLANWPLETLIPSKNFAEVSYERVRNPVY